MMRKLIVFFCLLEFPHVIIRETSDDSEYMKGETHSER